MTGSANFRQPWLLSWLTVILLMFDGPAVCAAETVPDYLTEIKPLLKEKCYSCHGVLRQEAGLRLETRGLLMQGGDSGAAIVEQDAAASLLIQRVTADPDSRMPPEGEGAPLTAEQLRTLKLWIDSGAPAPDEAVPAGPDEHWAFQPIQRPDIPDVSDPDWNRHPVDAFIAAGHQQQGLRPVQTAPRDLLLRRLYLDLTGLPPTLQQLDQFLADESDSALESVATELLNSPQYGERWGRHWMDIWRYSDWYGLGAQVRNSQKHIWHWRDWIIESLNQDKGYDRMIVEMLAGDEAAPGDPDVARATGFLARQYYLFNRTTWLDDTIEHTSKAFLGLTMNCVKCHAHKYDPIAHADYYRMRAFFEPYQVRIDAVPGQLDLEQDGIPRAFDAHPDAPTYVHLRGDDRNPDKSRLMEPGLPEVLSFGPLPVEPVALPPESHNPALRAHVLRDHLAAAEAGIAAAVTSRDAAIARLTELRASSIAVAGSAAETGDAEADAFLQDDFSEAQPEVWETGPGEWTYTDGHVVQSTTGFQRAWLRTRQEHPQDFEATIEFTTTGGEKWKSVGLAWDVAGNNEKMVYLSAVAPGSKLQVSYKEGDQQVYPPAGAQPRAVELNRPYTMTIAVRGSLVNVAIDGSHAIAFEVPLRREPGRMDLVAFDAAVRFDSITVRPLPANRTLMAAGQAADGRPATIEGAEAAVAAAEAELAAARLRPAAIQTAYAANQVKFRQRTDDSEAADPSVDAAVRAAAEAFRAWELAVAEAKLRTAEQKPDDAPALMKARQVAETARAAAEKPDGQYLALTASAKSAEGPDENEESRRRPYPPVSTGRRLALARWITDRRNPLTARVAVNHIWLRHFGQPLVETVDDFGLRAPAPVQRELLDWLAAELMDHDWSMKHLHRLIVTSRTWQLASTAGDSHRSAAERDPANAYYWRRIPVRMESEVIRDSLLHLAGRLDLTMGGPSVDASTKSQTNRRSLYFKHSRDDQNEFLVMFDDADILRCYRRSESVVPQQALALANSELSLAMAREIAASVPGLSGDVSDDAFVETAFRCILGRRPNAEEQRLCRDALAQTRTVLADQPAEVVSRRAKQNLIHALINHNDFVTIR